MRSTNKEKLKEELIGAISNDKFDLSIFVFKNLKREVAQVVKRYVNVKDEDIKLNVKTFKDGKTFIEIKCVCEGFLKN